MPALQAGLVSSTTIPSGGLTPSSSLGPVFWDVDGNGSNDFVLLHTTTSGTHYALFGAFNNARLVEPAVGPAAISKLPVGFVVGPTMVASVKFNTQNLGHTITASGSLGAGAAYGGWHLGDTGQFGFKFQIGADTHYGFGTMEISLNGPAGQGFRILDAWYDDQADTAVTTVPESRSTAALLALGASGVIAWRQRRKQSEARA
jgi:hypothetical protein